MDSAVTSAIELKDIVEKPLYFYTLEKYLQRDIVCCALKGWRCIASVGIGQLTTEQLQTLLHQIIKRIMRLLTRKGYLVEEQGELKPKIL